MDGINLKNVPNQAHNPRASFDLSFKRMFDFKYGDIIPVLMQPVMPDDEFAVSYQFLHRMAPFISQVFQDYKIKFDFYFVPNQLVYHNFELFMSAGYDGNTSYVHPHLHASNLASLCNNGNWNHSIFDYFDINPSFFAASNKALQNERLNAIPFAAYIQCYIDYFLGVDTALNKLKQSIMSDEYILGDGDMTTNIATLFGRINTRNPDWVLPGTGMDASALFAPFKCLYPLDYFTSCRANPQLGPVMTIPVSLVSTDTDGSSTFRVTTSPSSTGSVGLSMNYTSGSNSITVSPDQNPSNTVVINGSIFKNVATINDFYSAARLTELITLYNYSGFTPAERQAAEFGVKNPDSRMHKAEWVHSSIHDASVGEVFSNNVNNAPASSNNMDIAGAGTAISATNSGDRGFQFYSTQYGYLVGLMTVFPEAAYSQGLPRHFSVNDRFEYPHYLLSEIGMADVKVKELYASQSNDLHWNDSFAYMSQYGDYKVNLNRVNGSIRNSLMYMNAGRRLNPAGSLNFNPAFNDRFLQVVPQDNDLDRTFNVTSYYPHDCPLLCKLDFNIHAKRQLPYYGLPRF